MSSEFGHGEDGSGSLHMSMAEDGVDVVEVPDCFWLGGDLHMSVAEGGVDVVEEVVPDVQGVLSIAFSAVSQHQLPPL